MNESTIEDQFSRVWSVYYGTNARGRGFLFLARDVSHVIGAMLATCSAIKRDNIRETGVFSCTLPMLRKLRMVSKDFDGFDALKADFDAAVRWMRLRLPMILPPDNCAFPLVIQFKRGCVSWHLGVDADCVRAHKGHTAYLKFKGNTFRSFSNTTV